MERLLPVVLTHLACFLAFLWLLNRFAVKPVLRLLDERRERIASKFDQIANSEKRIEALKEEYEDHLKKIDEEARKRMLEEVNRGRRIAEEIAENARVEAGRIVEKARANTQLELDQAREQLKDEVVAITIAAAEKLLRERLDDHKHREMVASFIDQMQQS